MVCRESLHYNIFKISILARALVLRRCKNDNHFRVRLKIGMFYSFSNYTRSIRKDVSGMEKRCGQCGAPMAEVVCEYCNWTESTKEGPTGDQPCLNINGVLIPLQLIRHGLVALSILCFFLISPIPLLILIPLPFIYASYKNNSRKDSTLALLYLWGLIFEEMLESGALYDISTLVFLMGFFHSCKIGFDWLKRKYKNR